MGIIPRSGLTKSLKSWFFHPLILSLIATMVILQIIPINIPKYKIKTTWTNRSTTGNKGGTVWDDLQKDGISDLILISQDILEYAVVGVYFYPGSRVKEWDIPGKLLDQYNNDFFLVFETDPNRQKEIVIFTQSHDSVFLSRISDLNDSKPVWEQIFITKIRLVNGNSDARIISPCVEDIDLNGKKELVFGITSGFSIYPRALFICDLTNNSIIRSIETGNYLSGFQIADICGDRRKEIITEGYAPKNIEDTAVAFHDSSNWAMIFDHNLRLLFTPTEYPGRTGSTQAICIPHEPGADNLYLFWFTPKNSYHRTRIYRINERGENTFLKELSDSSELNLTGELVVTQTSHKPGLIMPMCQGDIYLFDTSFQAIRIIPLNQPISYLKSMDVDIDGSSEILIFDLISKMLTIYRENFNDPASVKIESSEIQKTTISLRKSVNNSLELCISGDQINYRLSYLRNPLWNARFGIWVIIWLSILLFTLLIRRTTRIQIESRQNTENKITQLQLAIVRNQMDPHFTMNAINAVVDAINREEKEQARDNLLHFSKMYRSLVLSADKIKRTLREEIEFTENYLALEQFRFREQFRYFIEVMPDVDQKTEVPKMVIQSPVENAVKHGLSNREGSGEVKISIRKEDRNLVIKVMDNGVGRQAAGEAEKSSTGKGMEMMSQFFDLYQRITGVKVQSFVTDLEDETGKPAGTEVTIQIQLS